LSDKNCTYVGGPGCLTLLTILFIALKLTGVINWSWFWVLAPVWIPWSLVVVFVVVFIFAFNACKKL
jgi:hypothetical protein